MRILYNLKVIVKLLASFFILVGIMVIIGVLSINAMGKINSSNTFLYENNFQCAVAMGKIDALLTETRLLTQRIVVAEIVDATDSDINQVKTITAQMEEYEAFYEKNIKSDEDRELFDAYMEVTTKYREERAEAIELAKSGNYKEASEYNEDVVRPLAVAVQGEIDKLVEFNSSDAQQSVDDAEADYQSSVTQTVTILILSAVFSTLLGFIISKVITGPLKAVNVVSNRIAEGDLTAEMKQKFLTYKDEIGDVSRNVEAMKQGLITTISGIKKSSDDLGEQVKSTNITLTGLNDSITDTSAATEELSAGMEETGASAQEMNGMATEIDNAVDNVANMANEGASKAGEIHTRASELNVRVKQSIEKSEHIFSEIRESLEKAWRKRWRNLRL